MGSDFRVYFNVDGKVRPFAAESGRERLMAEPLDASMNALRVDIRLAPEAKGRAGELSL